MKDTSRNAKAVEFRKLKSFVKSLTPRERKKLKKFRKLVWWWRLGSTKHPVDFKADNSLAFNYELARRVKRKLRLQPFPDVAGLCRNSLSALDETPLKQLPFRALEDKAVKVKGWLPLTMEWNLNLPNAELLEAFTDFIKNGRKNEGCPEPVRNDGIRRRPQPWLWLELMDIADYKIHRIEEKDKTTLRQARKRANEKWLLFLNAMTQTTKPNAIPSGGDIGYIDAEGNGFVNVEDAHFADFISSAPTVKTPFRLWRGIWPTEIRNK